MVAAMTRPAKLLSSLDPFLICLVLVVGAASVLPVHGQAAGWVGTMADFAKNAPGIDWTAYWNAAGLGAQKDFIVWHPGAVVGAALAGYAASRWLGGVAHIADPRAPQVEDFESDEAAEVGETGVAHARFSQ